MNVSGKWKFGGRRTVARRIASEIREHLAKNAISKSYNKAPNRKYLKGTNFMYIRANVLTWRLIASALEEVTK